MDKTRSVILAECIEYRNEAYNALEDIINSSETALRSEVRRAAIGIKAYVDTKNKELKADVKEFKADVNEKFETLDQKIDGIKNLLVKLVESKT